MLNNLLIYTRGIGLPQVTTRSLDDRFWSRNDLVPRVHTSSFDCFLNRQKSSGWPPLAPPLPVVSLSLSRSHYYFFSFVLAFETQRNAKAAKWESERRA